MAFVTPGIGHEVGHLAACFLPSEVGIQKFRTAYMCSKRGGEASERGVRACLSRPVRGDFDTFCAFSEGWQLGNRGFGDVVFHCFTAFYVNFDLVVRQ